MNVHHKLREAIAAHTSQRFDDAEALYRAVLKKKKDEPIALHHLGLILSSKGDHAIAESLIRQSIKTSNTNAKAHNSLGIVLAAQKKYEPAIEAYKRSLRISPNASTQTNLAAALIETGALADAIAACHTAITMDPQFALAHFTLGVALQQKHDPKAAIAAFQKAISIQPNFPEAFTNLGLVYVSTGQMHDAITAYQKAIALRPTFSDAYNNLGVALSATRSFDPAISAFRRAVALDHKSESAALNLAKTLRKIGSLEDAVVTCTKALSVHDNCPAIALELIHLKRHLCDWTSFDADHATLRSHSQTVEPFVFLFAAKTPDEQMRCAASFAAQRFKNIATLPRRENRRPGRIRIGYLSSDYREHATAYLIAGLIEAHDRSKFEVFAYSYGYDDNGPMRKRLNAGFDHFIDISNISDKEAAAKIAGDDIDILLDLKGYTGDARPDILAMRGAPIQINFLGFPSTMGVSFIDYILADAVVAPTDQKNAYVEKIIHLPHCYQPNDCRRPIATPAPSRLSLGLPEDAFVFCSFNNPYKYTPDIFDVWMRLLANKATSVLWLLSAGPTVDRNLRLEAERRGVDPSRVVFAGRLPLPEHLARHGAADLFLDTFPIGAHTTASDALWAGLPLLTYRGETFASRVAASLLLTLGVPELIADSLAQYEQKAHDLAHSPSALSQLRLAISSLRQTSPLFDTERYTREFERILLSLAH